MIVIKYNRKFINNFKSRVLIKKRLLNLYSEQLNKFYISWEHPDLKTHALKDIGKRNLSGKWAFHVDSDCVVIFKLENEWFYFIDIGTHKQVYGIEGRGRRIRYKLK